MKQVVIILLVVMTTVPILAVPVNFIENWDSYAAQAPPAGPWYMDPHCAGSNLIFNALYSGLAVSLPYTYMFVDVENGDQAMLVSSGQWVEATDATPLSVEYWVAASLNKAADFYVEISMGDVHAPRLIDYPTGTPLPSPIPVLAYCKPLNSNDSGDWDNRAYFFDGQKWTAASYFDYRGTYELFTMVVDSDSAIVDTNLGIDNPADITRIYKGVFDRVSIYTWDFTNTTFTLIDDVSITGGNIAYCPAPFADADWDSDVDQDDFAIFQACFTGSGPATIDADCWCFDRDNNGQGDDDIDIDDYDQFQNCATGPSIPFDPGNPGACNP